MIWGTNKVDFQGGDDHLPANVHLIALTLVVGKLYIPQDHPPMTRTVCPENIIDASLPKSFWLASMAQWSIFYCIGYGSKCPLEWPIPCYDLTRPGKCFWLCLPWVDLGYVGTLQATTRSHFLHRKAILKADCTCEDKGVVYRQLQGWQRSLSRRYSFTTHFLISFKSNHPTSPVFEPCVDSVSNLPEMPKANSSPMLFGMNQTQMSPQGRTCMAKVISIENDGSWIIWLLLPDLRSTYNFLASFPHHRVL